MAINQKITFVEDDAAIRTMYKYKLESVGYEVSTAADGASALHVLEHVVPDLMLLDIKMPHLPGHEVLKRVRATVWGKDIKVIILTNISKDEAPHAFRVLGVDAYAVKAHTTPGQMLELVQKVLDR